jgi:hypothetical protein
VKLFISLSSLLSWLWLIVFICVLKFFMFVISSLSTYVKLRRLVYISAVFWGWKRSRICLLSFHTSLWSLSKFSCFF